MSLDKSTVARIARLARLEIDQAELEPLAGELSNILDWIEQLNEVSIEGVAPMTSVIPMALRQRDDVVTDGGYADRIVANAPETTDHYFLVPKVIE